MISELDRFSDHADSIVSLGVVDHHPNIMKELKGGYIFDYVSEKSNLRRQSTLIYFFHLVLAISQKLKC